MPHFRSLGLVVGAAQAAASEVGVYSVTGADAARVTAGAGDTYSIPGTRDRLSMMMMMMMQ